MKVEATQIGYYRLRRIKEGDKFFLKKESDFSEKWMKKLDEEAKAPVKKSSKAKPASKKAPSKDEEVI